MVLATPGSRGANAPCHEGVELTNLGRVGVGIVVGIAPPAIYTPDELLWALINLRVRGFLRGRRTVPQGRRTHKPGPRRRRHRRRHRPPPAIYTPDELLWALINLRVRGFLRGRRTVPQGRRTHKPGPRRRRHRRRHRPPPAIYTPDELLWALINLRVRGFLRGRRTVPQGRRTHKPGPRRRRHRRRHRPPPAIYTPDELLWALINLRVRGFLRGRRTVPQGRRTHKPGPRRRRHRRRHRPPPGHLYAR